MLFIMHRIARSRDILPILQWSVEFVLASKSGGARCSCDAATMAKAASAPSRETTLPSIAPVFLRVFIIFAPSLPNLRAMAWSWASDSSLEWSAGSEIPWSKLSWPFTSNTTKILNQSVIKPNHLILVNRLRGEKKNSVPQRAVAAVFCLRPVVSTGSVKVVYHFSTTVQWVSWSSTPVEGYG